MPNVVAVRRLLASLFLATVLLSACGGGSSAPPGNVGTSGATLISADGKAQLVVPAGAVGSPIQVDLAAATGGFTADGSLVPGTTYGVTAPTTPLASDATLTIEVPAGAIPSSDGGLAAIQRVAAIPGGGLSLPITCSADGSGCWFVDTSGGGCLNPDKTVFLNGVTTRYPVLLGYDTNYTGTYTLTFPGQVYTGPAAYCAKSAPPAPQVATLNGPATALVTTYNPTTRIATTRLPAIKTAIYGILVDVLPPTIKISASVTAVNATQSRISLSATASDNRAVTRVSFARLDAHGTGTNGAITLATTPLAQLTAAPYKYDSLATDNAALFGKSYIACAFDAAGNQACDYVVPLQGAPNIASFTADRLALPYPGGQVNLSWAVTDANALSITSNIGPNIGNVLGVTTVPATVSQTTTFTLTAGNPVGPSSATVTVSVDPQPLPLVNSFTASSLALPGAGNVTLDWTTSNADTLTLDDGTTLRTVTGTTSITLPLAATTSFKLTAHNTSGNDSRTLQVVVATASDRFIDALAGSDGNAGTVASPYKTLAKALGGTAPVNVYFADGSYTTATQGATTITVPNGVALRAINAGAVTLQGLSINFAGSGTVAGMLLDSNTQLTAAAASGTPTLVLTGVRFAHTQQLAALALGGTVTAMLDPGATPGGLYSLRGQIIGRVAELSGAAQLLVQGGTFDGSSLDNLGGPFLVNGTASLVFDAVTIHNLKPYAGGTGVITMSGSGGVAHATLRNGTSIDGFDSANPAAVNPAIVLGANADLTLDNGRLATGQNGVAANGTGVTVTIKGGSSFTGITGNAIILGGTDAASSLRVNNASISGGGANSQGVRTSGPLAIDINLLTASGNQRGGLFSQPGSLKIRNSSFTGNSSYGVEIDNPPGTASDLGTAASPGGNTFTTNGVTGLYVVLTGVANAVGNTWTANVQGADANGKYPTGLPNGTSTVGPNFQAQVGATINVQ